MSAALKLIVGLGNPGRDYEGTRHNAGFWFVDALADAAGATLRNESKFHGEAAKIRLHGEDLWLLKPMTFMNRSGQAVSALARFYKIEPEQILVVHDELDLPPGGAKLKRGGGHAGHNGLRDIISAIGSKDFLRLRLGIGHPGSAKQVSNYVLSKPGKDDRISIDHAIAEAERILPELIDDQLQKAMNLLHSKV